MRRLIVIVAGVALLPTTGCYHIAGKCDCAPPVQPCCMYGLYPAGGMPVVPASAVEVPAAAEGSPQMPREPITKEKIGYPRDM